MPRLVNYSYFFILLISLSSHLKMAAQQWVSALDGIYPSQWNYPDYYDIKFKSNLQGKDWIYGTWLDEDSVRRCVAYREGGKWVPLPITIASSGLSKAKDIAMWGDTLLIGGQFGPAFSDLDSSQNFVSSLLKWWNDSLWSDPYFHFVQDIDVSGDSILIWAGYASPTDTLGYLVFKHDTLPWQNVGNPVHPTETWGFFGAIPDLQIHNGQIYTVNNGSPPNDSTGWKGIVRWDGTQWHPYPYGLWGGWARANCFEFYQGDMYMGGSFSVASHPNNPGTGIAKWDGTQWTSMGGGVGNFVEDLFVYNDLLYAKLGGPGYFADAPISYFAGWDGHQWCGTPGNFARPPISFGFANDTLFCTFNEQSTTIGTDTVTHMNYFVGNYVTGPNAVCSTYNLGNEEERLSKNKLLVYPNPFSNTCNVTVQGAQIHSLSVYNTNGCLVFSTLLASGQTEFVLNLNQLAAGLYILQVNGTLYSRIVKM